MDFALGGFGGVAMQEIGFKTAPPTICTPENTFRGLVATLGHSQQKRAQETIEIVKIIFKNGLTELTLPGGGPLNVF